MKARSRLRPSALSHSPTPVASPPAPPQKKGPARSRLTTTSAASAPSVANATGRAEKGGEKSRSFATGFMGWTSRKKRASTSSSRSLPRASLQTSILALASRLGAGVWLVAQGYAPYLLFLLLALPGYIALAYLLTHISPTRFQNWLLPDSYLVPQLLFFISNYCFLSFLLKNYRRAITATVFIQVMVLLKLQRFDLQWWLPILFLVLFGILELLWIGICKLRPAPSQPRRKRR